MSDVTATNEFTRFMVMKYDERKKVIAPTAFQGSFFGVPETGAQVVFSDNAESIELDKVRADGRRLARLVNRGASSDDTSRIEHLTSERFTNEARAWPLIETEGDINSNQLLKRMAGENPFTPAQRQAKLTAKALEINMLMADRQIRLWEYLARESVLNGQHPAILGTTNTDLIYDFYRKASHTFAVAAKWDVVGTDIIGDFDLAADLIQQDSYNPVVNIGALVGTAGFEGLRKNTQAKAEADIRRFHSVELHGPTTVPTEFNRYIDNGFALAGWIKTYKNRTVWLFTYDVTFTDDFTTPGVDTETDWMPVDKCLVFSPKARCDKYFGPPDRLPISASEMAWYQDMFGFNMSVPPELPNIQNPSVIDPRGMHFDAYEGVGHKAVTVRMQSAPIFPTTETDAFVLMTGLV
jgi:hypothetical protein